MQREREGLGEFRLLLRRDSWWAGGRAHPSDLRHAQPTAPWGRLAKRTGAAAISKSRSPSGAGGRGGGGGGGGASSSESRRRRLRRCRARHGARWLLGEAHSLRELAACKARAMSLLDE